MSGSWTCSSGVSYYLVLVLRVSSVFDYTLGQLLTDMNKAGKEIYKEICSLQLNWPDKSQGQS